MRKRNNQFIYFLFLICFNLVFYLKLIYGIKINDFKNETTNETFLTLCYHKSLEDQQIIGIMDVINRALLPFSIILLFSFLLIIELYKSRRRILGNFKLEETQYLLNEIRMTVSILCTNFMYVFCQIPISIYALISNYDGYFQTVYLFFYYVFYMSYSINFYILFFSNRLFRDETIKYFKKIIFK